MKNIRIFYLKIFNFLVVKFSVYLNRHVSVMNKWVSTWENIPSDTYAQVWQMILRMRAVWPESSLFAWRQTLHYWLSKRRPGKILVRPTKCAGWSESLQGAHVWRYVFSRWDSDGALQNQWTRHEIKIGPAMCSCVFRDYGNSKYQDQPAQLRSLIRTSAVRLQNNIGDWWLYWRGPNDLIRQVGCTDWSRQL